MIIQMGERKYVGKKLPTCHKKLPTQYNYLIINNDVGMQVKCAKNIFCLLKVERIGKDTEASYI